MKKVLIALDYDPSAEKIAETGYALARAMDAQVVLLHVTADAAYYANLEYTPIMGFAGYGSFTNVDIGDISRSIQKESSEFLAQSKAHLGDDNIITVVADGETATTIVATAATGTREYDKTNT